MLCLVTQSCPTPWDSLDRSPPGSSVHGIYQERILEWLSFSLPGDLPKPNVWASQVAQQVKNLPAIQETQKMRVWSQGEEDPLEEEMATYSIIPAWKIPWTKKPDGLWYKTQLNDQVHCMNTIFHLHAQKRSSMHHFSILKFLKKLLYWSLLD